MYSVFDLSNSVAAILSGLDLNNVDDLYGAYERAARTFIQKADVPEASQTENITLYDGVYDNPCPSYIFGTAVKDIRPQGITRPLSDYTYKRPGEIFDRTKGYLSNGTMFSFDYYNGTPVMRIKSTIPQSQNIIDPMTAVNNWVVGGVASGLIQDTAVYYQNPASLRFQLGTGTGTLTETLANPVNLASYQGVGVAFLAIDAVTAASNLTSINLELGSSSSNYSSVTATTGFLGGWVNNQWLLVPFDFSLASNTGNPNWSAIQYVKCSFVTSGGITNFRTGDLFISQPSPAQILYQSAAIFIPVGSTTTKTTITANTDTITLNDAAFTIYQNECAYAVLQQTGGGAADASMAQISATLNGSRTRTGVVIAEGLYDLYRGDNPTEVLRSVGNYYNDNGTYGRGMN